MSNLPQGFSIAPGSSGVTKRDDLRSSLMEEGKCTIRDDFRNYPMTRECANLAQMAGNLA